MKDKKSRRTGRIFALPLLIFAAVSVFTGCGRADEGDARLKEFREGLVEADTTGPDGEGKAGAEGGDGNTGVGARPDKEEEAVVHVCGAVNNPGVYTLAAGSRVYEALEAAGGISSGGRGDVLNQAKLIKDGERIYVPTKEEVAKGGFSAGGASGPAKVDINTASREELMALPGIGESKADSIISYREAKGGFKSIEEIKNVEGIKEGVYGKIKDRITV